MKRTALIITLVLILILLAGCSAKSSGSTGDSHSTSSSSPAYAADEGGSEADAQIPVDARPGLLTAGEWNDNENYDFILGLAQSNDFWKFFELDWKVNISERIQVIVRDDTAPVVNATVELLDDNEGVIYSAQTNNNGIVYLFNNLKSTNENQAAFIRASTSVSDIRPYEKHLRLYDFDLPALPQPRSLDLMLVIDTTGSMSDELEFLKAELGNVIERVSKDNANIPIRLSINVYRDITDEYVVRSMPFSEDIGEQLAFLNKQFADGGGDFPEAVEDALADALYNHNWNADATAKIILLVLDAPPHNTPQIRDEMHGLMEAAAKSGIRIIPVASSGIDELTEFLLRSMAMATGGTYVFLTDHSGVGESHLDPTIGAYEVELLNDLLVRLLNGYVE